MMEDNESSYRRWVEEVWNGGREESIEELFDENGVASYPYFLKGTEPIRGRENFKKFYRQARETFADIKVRIEEMVSQGNQITVLCEVSAKRKDIGSDGLPRFEPVNMRSLCKIIYRNGKITELWNNISISEESKQVFSYFC
ncbi:MAG: ester cyclase [Pyrinomonadaceae bacterium]